MTQGPPPYIAVVPRGETPIFRALESRAHDSGLIEVIWDRRRGDRRARRIDVDRHRRLGERRRQPHDTWALGFVLAAREEASLSPWKTIARSAE